VPTALETVQDLMAAFIEAWPSADTTALGSFFSEDALYQNGPLEPVRGRAAIESTFAQFMKVGGEVDVEMIHMMAEGLIVMTERIDHLTTADGTTASLPMMGVIEVHDGLVVAWRDYFDLRQFRSQILGET
jgi:limonene-1,2-epoxide hydrolase